MPYSAIPFGFETCVLKRSSAILAYWGQDLVCRFANDAYAAWFGLSPSDIIGARMEDVFGKDAFEHARSYIDGELAGHLLATESHPPCAVGKRHGLAGFQPDRIDGQVVGYIAEIRDISSMKELEVAMEKAERLGHIGNWRLDLRTNQVSWSAELFRIFGHDPSKPPPSVEDHLAIYVPNSRMRIEAAVLAARTEGVPYEIELEFRKPCGGTGWIEARGAAEWTGNEVTALYGTAQDVTRRHARLDQLKEQISHIRQATDAAQLGLWHWDQATDEVTWENTWPQEILGIPMTSAPTRAGQLVKEFLAAEQDDELYYAIRKALCRDEGFRFLGQVRRRSDGKLRWIELIGGAEGLHALNGTIMDVTDRVEAEEAMRLAAEELADLDARKNDFLAILGHELRNCLSPLQSGVQSIKQSPTGCAPVKLQEVMARQVRHLGRLIDDIFDIRKISTGELHLEQQVVSLHQVVSESIEMCRCLVERSHHSLRYHIHDGEVEVRGDPVRLAQIFSNIIGNAVKFTPPSGTIDVSVAVENGMAMVSVTDNGIGMSEEELQTVFGLYTRANNRNCRAADGLGIGLHLVRTLTELQGGTVGAVSAGPGKGTTLTVRLPCRQ